MNKLLIVDGSGLLFQSFYGMPNKIKNYKGEYVEAVICFIGILLKTVRMLDADNVLVVFDGENKLERRDVCESYKANRVDYTQVRDEDNPYCQLDVIKCVLDKLNVCYTETTNCEADDLIASIVNDYGGEMEIVISSSDKDFYQLINDRVSVFTYRGKVSKLWTKQEIIIKYGFEPKYFCTLKALSGDKSDNIMGVKGIGPLTATELIKKYGDLNNIYHNVNNLSARVRELLIENKERAYRNFSIIELFGKTGLWKKFNCSFEAPKESSVEILKKFDIL